MEIYAVAQWGKDTHGKAFLGAGTVLAVSWAEAEQIARALVLQRWPSTEGWKDHEVAVELVAATHLLQDVRLQQK